MTARSVTVMIVLLLATVCATGQQHPGEPAAPDVQHSSSKAGPPGGQCTCAMSVEQASAMKSDLQRMRTLVQQMQFNLAALPPGVTPLRHQFELEIEIWQVLLGHMEESLASSAPSQSGQH